MSSFLGEAAQGSGTHPALHGVFRAWHVLCISICSGCIYWPPLIMESNVPPEILASSPSAGDTIVLDRPKKAWVQVYDEDDPLESLEYTWFLDDGSFLSYDLLPKSEGAIVDLPLDAELDGQTLHCVVRDAQRGSVEIEWPITVILEGT